MTADLTGLVFREVDVTRADERERAFRIVSGCELAAIGWTDTTLDAVGAQLSNPDVSAEHRLFAELDGEPVGLLVLEVDPHGREVFLDAFAVGRQTPALLSALVDRGLRLAEAIVADDWRIRAGSFAEDETYREVLSAAGFTPVRRFWRMLLPLTGRSADEPSAPPGVNRRIATSEEDRRLLHRMFRESFAEHWGTTLNRPTDEWLAHLETGAGHDPSGWWLAYLDGEPVGLCIVDDYLAEFDEGHVRTLGVVRSARGRGVARWLLGCAAADAVARGRTGLALNVDGENSTGATQLYQSVGFRIRQAVDAWELTRPAASG